MPSVVLFCSDSLYQGLVSLTIRYMCIIIYEHVNFPKHGGFISITDEGIHILFYLDISESYRSVTLHVSILRCNQLCIKPHACQQQRQQSLQWRHNGPDSVSNHQPHDYLFTQPFIQTQIKANIKAPRHWPLWPVNSLHKWPVTGKMFPFDDVIMAMQLSQSMSLEFKLLLLSQYALRNKHMHSRFFFAQGLWCYWKHHRSIAK